MQNAIIEFLLAKAKKKEKQRIYCRGDAALQQTATDCNRLQHTATDCNTPARLFQVRCRSLSNAIMRSAII
jgi:hypothetical protein